MAEGQNSKSAKKERGRIVSLEIKYPSDIMHTLIPHTQHITKLTFSRNPPYNVESLFNRISIHNPMLEELDVGFHLKPNQLLPVVSTLPKLENLAKLKLSLNSELVEEAESMSSVLFSSLEPLLVNKLKCITLRNSALNSSSAEALSRSLQSQYCSLVTLKLY